MTMSANDNERHSDDPAEDYSSPPCMMHLVDPVSGRVVAEQDVRQQQDLKRWRTAERERLIALRLAIPAGERRRLSEQIMRELDGILGDLSGKIVGAYLPFRGEPDLRGKDASPLADTEPVPVQPS